MRLNIDKSCFRFIYHVLYGIIIYTYEPYKEITCIADDFFESGYVMTVVRHYQS
jgi:hypothetical protein